METITDEVIPEVKENPLDNKKVNRAAYEFQNLTKVIRSEVKTLSLRSLSRVLINVIEYPFNTSKAKMTLKEQELFLHILLSSQAKSVMNEAMALSKQDIEEQVINPIADEVIAKQGESNNE